MTVIIMGVRLSKYIEYEIRLMCVMARAIPNRAQPPDAVRQPSMYGISSVMLRPISRK